MSKEFNQLKNNILTYKEIYKKEWEQIRAEEKSKEEQKKIADLARRNETDKSLLEKSGILPLFREIRDSGLLEENRQRTIFKKVNFWGKETISNSYFLGSITEKVLINHPPEIKTIEAETESDFVYVDLVFNGEINTFNPWPKDGLHSINGKGFDNYDYIRVIVINNIPNIVNREDYRNLGTYTPIQKDELVNTISEAIKNPLHYQYIPPAGEYSG